MLKVFLAEDEFVVREGIKHNIDWAGEGFCFCGEAGDGELAYPMIQRERPDIIITDIRMPFMDGLELSRLIKRELPDSRIIILSGHEEFTYAQEAIRIGVAQYLLKPISSAELLKTVKSLRQQILQEREERENYERYRQEMQENEQEGGRKLFNDLAAGSLSLAQALERGRELGLELAAPCYQIVLLQCMAHSGGQGYNAELLSLDGTLQALADATQRILWFDRGIEGCALLVKGESEAQLEQTLKSYLHEMQAVLARCPSVRCFGGIGMPVVRLAGLAQSYETAARAFAHRFFSEDSAFIRWDEPSHPPAPETLPLDPQELGAIDLKKFEAFLKSGKVEEIPFFVEEFLQSVDSISRKSFLFRQYVLMDTYITAQSFLREIGEEQGLGSRFFGGEVEINRLLRSPQQEKEYIQRILSLTLGKRDEVSTKRYRRMIEQVKDYLQEQFANEALSLNEAAAYVNLSPSHFSAVFSRETGQSFIRYLTDLRMNKAKELLKCTDLRSAEISTAVGYKDPHYFSYLFKKLHGSTPMQYRAAKG